MEYSSQPSQQSAGMRTRDDSQCLFSLPKTHVLRVPPIGLPVLASQLSQRWKVQTMLFQARFHPRLPVCFMEREQILPMPVMGFDVMQGRALSLSSDGYGVLRTRVR